MNRAYGTFVLVYLCNELKPVVTRWAGPTALRKVVIGSM